VKVLITGATGFIGRTLTKRLVDDGQFAVAAAVRQVSADLPDAVRQSPVGDIGPDTNWEPVLQQVDVVVHLAARVHVMSDTASDPLAAYRRINRDAAAALALHAASSGVRRFVFLSSLKVNGDSGIFSESDTPAPKDPYGISKHEAEAALREIATRTRMEVVIIRPPLVYGPGVKANFLALMRLVARGIPLPFGAIHNRRSLVAVDNLVDFIVTCIVHPTAANQTFLVSDGADLSTTDLIRRLALAMDRPARLFPIPQTLLMTGAVLLGKRDLAQRLLGTLQVDITKARTVLGWQPPVTMDQGLQATVKPLQRKA